MLPSLLGSEHNANSLRMRARKQRVLTRDQIAARDELLGARYEKKQAEARRKEELAATRLKRWLVVAQQNPQKMVEERKFGMSTRTQAMTQRQQTMRQHEEEAEARRVAAKDIAAASRRKAALQRTADLGQEMLVRP